MNIREQMSQLGEIAGVGYSPTDADVDQLVGRTRRSRGIRQGSTAVMGSVGALALGVLGAQLFIGLNNDQDAGMRDGNAITNGAYLNLTWDQNYGSGYTGSGQTREDIVAAWDALHAAAAVAPQEVAPAAQPPASTETHPKAPPATEPGTIVFADIVGVCKNYTDAATGRTIYAAYIDAGSWRKIVTCVDGEPGEYRYIYKNGTTYATVSGTTCTGVTSNKWGANHQVSCLPMYALADAVGEWNGENGGTSRWTLNNENGYLLLSPGTYKWFQSGTCANTASNTIYTRGVRQCGPIACDGWYYTTSQHPVKDGHTYSWNGATWVQDPEPTPTPTETTPPPDPEPTPSASTPPV